MKKLKNNNGLSLVEILVSMAIVGIMIFPIGSIINTAIKTNKKSETRQQAIQLGQQIVEEIETIGDIDKSGISLSGGYLKGDINNTKSNAFYSSNNYKKGDVIYDIDLSLKQNTSIIHNINNSDDKDFISTVKDTLDLTTNSASIVVQKNGSEKAIPIDVSDTKLQVETYQEGNNKKLRLRGNDSIDITYNIKSNKVVLNFTSGYKLSEGITIDVYNSLDTPMDLYIKKSYDCDEKIYIEKQLGQINIFNERDKEESLDSQVDNLYDITVKVNQNGKELFSWDGSKNINIIG